MTHIRLAYLVASALAVAASCIMSRTPVEMIRERWRPVGEVMCHATSDRVRECTDERELEYRWVCEDRGWWSCKKVEIRGSGSTTSGVVTTDR